MYLAEEEYHELEIDEEVSPFILEPSLLKSAQRIYQTYCNLHKKLSKQPIGVAIDPKTHRGQLLFNKNPILLYGECFVSVDDLIA